MQRSESSLSPFTVRKQRLRTVKSFVTQLGREKVKVHWGSQALKFRLSSCCVLSVYASDVNTKMCTQGELQGQTVLILLVLGVENENRGIHPTVSL